MKMLKLKEAAEQFGVTMFWLRKAVRSGKVPSCMLSGKYYIQPEALADYLHGQMSGGSYCDAK